MFLLLGQQGIKNQIYNSQQQRHTIYWKKNIYRWNWIMSSPSPSPNPLIASCAPSWWLSQLCCWLLAGPTLQTAWPIQQPAVLSSQPKPSKPAGPKVKPTGPTSTSHPNPVLNCTTSRICPWDWHCWMPSQQTVSLSPESLFSIYILVALRA